MLLWKSSKLIGAKKSGPSGGVWMTSYLVELAAFEVPRLRRELLLLMEWFRVESFVVSMEELPECKDPDDRLLRRIKQVARQHHGLSQA